MTTAELLFRNATIVDGTGAPAYQGDVAVGGGRILATGTFAGTAARTVDASGLILAPGFIDVHTHYDAQLWWDAEASPSLLHGVTTVVIGNCSISLAPVRPEDHTTIARLFETIEDIPAEVFEAAVPWGWETFPQYLERMRGGLGVHVGALLGLSTLRLHVMGEAARERTATDDEIDQMCQAVREAMAAGAIGVSGSNLDVDERLQPVACRKADWKEKLALCKAMMECGHGVWQSAPEWPNPAQQLLDIAELGRLSRETGCTASFAKLFQHIGAPQAWRDCLAALEHETREGAHVYAQVPPRAIDLTLRLDGGSILLLVLPSWMQIMRLPLSERLRRFSSPMRRRQLVREASLLENVWQRTIIAKTFASANAILDGKPLAEVARARGQSCSEALLDIAISDGLHTIFQIPRIGNSDDSAVLTMLTHPCSMIGGSDAGAHLAQFSGAGDAVYVLEHLVREKKSMTLEHAVRELTARPAQLWGIKDRGVIKQGAHADLVLFDQSTIATSAELDVNDLPGGGRRLVRQASGIKMVVLGGVVAVEAGKHLGARTGTVAELGPSTH